ncbi:MAG: Sua5/YciO/YrdC/YwlC family protein [Myxococcota bacterium]
MGDLYKAKGMDHSKRCSVMCADLRSIGAVARAVPNEAFKFMRDHFPGPYTVLLLASRDLPRRATGGRKTIGVRVPDNAVSQALIEDFGGPVLITSLPGWVPGEELDPVGTAERMFIRPTVVLDQGPQFATPSTIIDFTAEPRSSSARVRGRSIPASTSLRPGARPPRSWSASTVGVGDAISRADRGGLLVGVTMRGERGGWRVMLLTAAVLVALAPDAMRRARTSERCRVQDDRAIGLLCEVRHCHRPGDPSGHGCAPCS